jgi:ATP-dependent helicase HrpA
VLVPTPAWTKAEFAAVRARVAGGLTQTTLDVVGRVAKVLDAAQEVRLGLPDAPSAAHADAIADIRAQFDRLLPNGFVTAAGVAHLADLVRYLTAMTRRLERLPSAAAADRERMARVQAVQHAYDELVAALPKGRAAAADVRDVARQLQELRVSLWAHQLGTPRPVSEQRIYRAIDAIGR